MGIYNRYTTAFLILAILSPQVLAKVRVPVKPSAETVIKGTATTGAVSTPAGEVAFYGADKVYSFATGDSVGPTVREVKPSTVGSVSYPYGPGAAYPNDPALSPANATAKVKPVVKVPKTRILDGLKKVVKTNPAQIVLGAATAGAVAAVGWLIDEGSQSPTKGQIVKPVPGEPAPLNIYKWQAHGNGMSSQASTPIAAFDDIAANFCWSPWENCTVINYVRNSPTLASATVRRNYQGQPTNTQEWQFSASAVGSCPAGYSISADGSCTSDQSGFAPVSDTDLQMLDPWVNQQSAEWLSGLLKEVCNGSPNPSQCYADMKSEGSLEGPATLMGPQTTKTSTFTRPDSTIGTRTETTKTKFDLTYGPDYFDVDTEKETTVTEDGELISTTTEVDTTEPQDVSDTPEEQPEPEYTFQDSDLPGVTPFYDQKYPDGLQGVWNQAKADIDNSNFISFLNSFVPSFSGSCPAFGLSFAIGNMINLGSHEFSSLCYVFDFIKIILLVTAVFTARAITFGG